MAQREAKTRAADAAGTRRHVVVVAREGTGARAEEGEKVVTAAACGAATAGVAGVGLAGAGVLVWWALAFRRAHEQLWMVPVGLVLLGTPLVAWLSLFASGACRRLGRLRAGAGADLQAPAVAPEA